MKLNSPDSWNCCHWMAQWMAISHLLFHLLSLFSPWTRDNEELPMSIADLIWVSYQKKNGLKSRGSWNLIKFSLECRVLKGDKAILCIKPPNTIGHGRNPGWDPAEGSTGITLEQHARTFWTWIKKKKKKEPQRWRHWRDMETMKCLHACCVMKVKPEAISLPYLTEDLSSDNWSALCLEMWKG